MNQLYNHHLSLIKLLLFLFVSLPLIAVGQASTVQDFDGNIYATTAIGEQMWMAGNLKVTHFNNGDPITKFPPDQMESASTEEWSLWRQEYREKPQYQNSKLSQEIGFMYNPFVINRSRLDTESRNVCPVGWHVPTQEDWDQLIETLGGHLAAGERLKSEVGWQDGENGNNDSGFNAQPGFESSQYGPGLQVIWWASQGSRGLASHETLSDMSNYDGSGMLMNRYGELEEASWYYIRCVKD